MGDFVLAVIFVFVVSLFFSSFLSKPSIIWPSSMTETKNEKKGF